MENFLKNYVRRCFVILAAGILMLLSLTTHTSFAQQLAEGWSEPVAIYSTEEFISGFRVLVDGNEQFHLFWLENPTETSATNLPGAVFYMHGNGDQWSTANDVLVASNSRRIPTYSLFVDRENNLLHSLYVDSLPYYVNVPLHQAQNVFAWSMPESILPRSVLSAAIYRHEGRNYMFYVPNQPPFELYLLYSDMEGDWSWPIQISDAANSGEIPIGGQLYVDQHGTMHLVWRQGALPDGGPPRRIAHVVSTDFGETWSVPQTIAEGQFASPTLTETPNGDLLILYIGAISIGGRYYQISSDGGDSWGAQQTIAEGIAGLTGHSFAWDSAGTLHYVSASHLGGLNGIAYMQWRENNGNWTRPINALPPSTESGRQAFEPVIHTTEGNRLHLFYLGPDHSTIFYTSARSTAPWIEPQPMPEPDSPPTPSITSNTTPEPTVTPATVPVIGNIDDRHSPGRNSFSPLINSLILTLAFILIALFFRTYKPFSGV